MEIGLLAGGIATYLTRSAMPAIRKAAVIAFGIALVIVQIGDTYVPRTPLSDKVTAMGVWIFYTLFVIVEFAIERIGRREQTNAPWSSLFSEFLALAKQQWAKCWQNNLGGDLLRPTIFIRQQTSKRCATVIH